MPFQKASAISVGVALATVITRGRFVISGANGLAEQAGAGASALGVALEDSTAEQDNAIPVAVLDGSVLEVEAGAAIDVSGGAVNIAADAQGRAVTATTGNTILGVAKSSAGAAGEFISFYATQPGNAAV